MLSGCWPHYGSIGQKAKEVVGSIDKGEDIVQYQTTGQVKRAKGKRTAMANTMPVA